MGEKLKKQNIWFFIVIVAIISKLILFNSLIEINVQFEFMIFVSMMYIGFIYFLFNITSSKNSRKWFFGIYSLITVIMFSDSMYYSYFNQLSSFAAINQVNQLSSVTESIKTLLRPLNLMLFLDLPIVYYYFKNYAENGEENKKSICRKKSLTVICSSLVIIIFCVLNPIEANFLKTLESQEFFTYHLRDIYVQIAKHKDVRDMTDEDVKDVLREGKKEEKELFGIAKNKNLIVIQVESFQNAFINKKYEGQELTPNLNKLIKDSGSMYFSNYYQQLGKGNTSDAEFVTNNSMYPTFYGQSYQLYEENEFYGLPWILRDRGYNTNVMHGYRAEFWNREKAYPNQGFERFISEKDFEPSENIGFGLNDISFFEQSANYMENFKTPFYSFMITLTCHNPYEMPEKYHNIKLKEEHKDTLFGNCLQAVYYTDEAIGRFIEDLKEKGIYEDSVIAIYGDHYALNCKDDENHMYMSEFLNKDYNYEDMMNIPLIITIPGEEINRQVEIVGGQIDFMPTMLNLFGIEEEGLVIFGQDLINAKSGFVASQTYLRKGSFITDDVIFEIARDNVFENSVPRNLKTGEKVNVNKCRENYEKAIEEINKSYYIMENNLIKELMKK